MKVRLRLREGGTVKGNLNWFLHPFHTYRVDDGEEEEVMEEECARWAGDLKRAL